MHESASRTQTKVYIASAIARGENSKAEVNHYYPYKITYKLISNLEKEVDYYQRRESKEKEVDEKFLHSKILAVTGVAGSGKSEFATYYINQSKYRDWVKYRIYCNNIDAIVSALSAGFSSADNFKIETTIQYMLEYFAIENGKTFFLFFDNVDSTETLTFIKSIAEILIKQLMNIRILITSQCECFYDDNNKTVDLFEGFTENEALAFLYKADQRYTNTLDSPKEEVLELAKRFDFLPLGIAAAKFYILKHKINPKEYLKELEDENKLDKLDLLEERIIEGDYRKKPPGYRCQRAAIRLSWNRLGYGCKEFTYVLLVLSHKKIPLQLLQEIVGSLDLQIYIEELKNISIIKIEYQFISMHKVSHDALKKYLNLKLSHKEYCENRFKKNVTSVVNFFDRTYQTTKDKESERVNSYHSQHILSLVNCLLFIKDNYGFFLKGEVMSNVLDLTINTAGYHIRISHFDTAKSIFEKIDNLMTSLDFKVQLENQWLLSSLYLDYGWLGIETGKLEEYQALKKLEACCKLREDYISHHNFEKKIFWQRKLIISKYNYASAIMSSYEASGEEKLLEQAEALLVQCKNIFQKIEDGYYEDIASVSEKDLLHIEIQLFNFYSIFYLLSKKYQKSISEAEHGLKLADEKYKDSFISPVFLKTLGISYFYLDDLNNAIEKLTECISRIQYNMPGKTHVSHVLECYYYLALLYYSKNNNIEKAANNIDCFYDTLNKNYLSDVLEFSFIKNADVLKCKIYADKNRIFVDNMKKTFR